MVEQFAFENAAFDDDGDAAVFDDSFIAAALIREPSAEARALHALQLRRLPDQRTGDEIFQPSPTLPPRWSVRPSHQFAALRPLPVVLTVTCILVAATALLILLR